MKARRSVRNVQRKTTQGAYLIVRAAALGGWLPRMDQDWNCSIVSSVWGCVCIELILTMQIQKPLVVDKCYHGETDYEELPSHILSIVSAKLTDCDAHNKRYRELTQMKCKVNPYKRHIWRLFGMEEQKTHAAVTSTHNSIPFYLKVFSHQTNFNEKLETDLAFPKQLGAE